MAIKVDDSVASAWGWASILKETDFMAACSGGAECNVGNTSGTFGEDDEASIVFILARTIKEQGVKLCPTQVQVGNKDYKNTVWFDYYDGNSTKCRWFCKTGYYGEGCTQKYNEYPPSYDWINYTLTENSNTSNEVGFWGKLDKYKRLSGGSTNQVDVNVFNFKDYKESNSSNEKAYTYVLAAISEGFGDRTKGEILSYGDSHGVLVGILKLKGEVPGGIKKKKSYFSIQDSIKILGTPIMLCATGFMPNPSDKYKCIKVDELSEIQLTQEERLNNLCAGFTKNEYKGAATMELYPEGSCFKYRCAGENMGFKSLDDKICINCPPRSGAKKTGECSEPCEKTWHYSKEKDACEKDRGLSKNELLYGMGQNIAPNSYEHACWPIKDVEKYKECVFNGGR